MDKALVIMAAGMGSRYGGLKQIDRIGPGGEVIMEYSLYDARLAGFNRAIFIIKRENESLFREIVGDRVAAVMDVQYAYQELDDLPAGFSVPEGRIKPWGTGHAVMSCRHLIDGPFAVINADDFYGRDAFLKLSRWADGMDSGANPPEYSMAGYLLKNTLTEHGHVARGVCETNDTGELTDINERTKIMRRDDGGVYYTENGTDWTALSEDSVVSMNCWCFPRSFMDELTGRFVEFLQANGNSQTAEYFLPFVVKELLEEGRCRVQVLKTGAKWFGVTYREDREMVASAIGEMVRSGIYPENLWAAFLPQVDR